MTVHDTLRDWLVTLGTEKGLDAWTPDVRNNVEFSKIRNAKIDYRPDVVWKNRRTGKKIIFELAFQEDYRTVIGEVLIASQVESFTKIYIIRPTTDENYWKNIESFLRLAFKEDGILKNYYARRPRFIIFERKLEKNRKLEEIKEKIVETLKDENWLK